MFSDEEKGQILMRDLLDNAPARYKVPQLMTTRMSRLLELDAVDYDADGSRIVKRRDVVQALAPWLLKPEAVDAELAGLRYEDPHDRAKRIAKQLNAMGLADALNRVGDEPDDLGLSQEEARRLVGQGVDDSEDEDQDD